MEKPTMAATSKDMLRKIQGTYPTYRAMQKAVLDLFNDNLAFWPPQYSYLQLITWAKQQKWIMPGEGKSWIIL